VCIWFKSGCGRLAVWRCLSLALFVPFFVLFSSLFLSLSSFFRLFFRLFSRLFFVCLFVVSSRIEIMCEFCWFFPFVLFGVFGSSHGWIAPRLEYAVQFETTSMLMIRSSLSSASR
jgi:hypothetical protein